MAQASENLVTAELGKLSNEELALRVLERQRQRREYPFNTLIQKVVTNDLAAIAKEAQERGIVLS